MARLLALLLLATALSGCGIKGDLARPAPLWGGGTNAEIPGETTAAASVENADDPLDEPVTPFDGAPLQNDDDEFTYGVDVAD